jgi:hypothetical protein
MNAPATDTRHQGDTRMTNEDLAKIRRTHDERGPVDMTGVPEELERFGAAPWMIEVARKILKENTEA